MVTGPTVSLKIVFFFFNDTATTEIYTLSLHDALPISVEQRGIVAAGAPLRGLYAGDVLHVFDTLAIPLIVEGREVVHRTVPLGVNVRVATLAGVRFQIGRASCRERV